MTAARPAGRRQRLAAFAVLMAVQFCYGWAIAAGDVLRPAYRDGLGLTLAQVGSGYSAQVIGALIGALVIGQLADRWSRRTLLALVAAGIGCAMLYGSVVTDYAGFLAHRTAIGFFAGGVFPLTVGIFVDLFDPAIRGRLASIIDAMYHGSVVALGIALATFGPLEWRGLLVAGGAPLFVIALLALLAIERGERPAGLTRRLPVAELFAPALRRRTMLLALMTGANFFAYQAFGGWLTIYLTDVRQLGAPAIGLLLGVMYTGNIVGCFFWGWVADHWGRRANAAGMVFAAATVPLFLAAPDQVAVLIALATVYGFMFSTVVAWGPWFAELYPPHLRATATSIYNWGRIISVFAPVITAGLARTYGLSASMLLAPVLYAICAGVWLSLPETLERRQPNLAMR